MVMCGADLSGIELRCLAHYLARYDGGEYGHELINGDIHQKNADKIGITRKQVKLLLTPSCMAQVTKKSAIPMIALYRPTKRRQKAKRYALRMLMQSLDLADLLNAVKRAADRKYVSAIDGRKIPVDSPHKALNYLLQSTAGVIAKRWMVIANDLLVDKAHQLAFIHDELQYETHSFNVNDVCSALESSAIAAGEYYNFRVPIAAESKSGNDWSEVH